MGFRSWIEKYESDTFDATSYFARWFKKKKIEVDSEDKDDYLKILKQHKANSTVKFAFESAWHWYLFSFVQAEGEGEVVPGVVEEIIQPVTVHVKKYLKGPSEEGERSEPETIAVRKFVTQPAIVGLKLGLTRDQGGFESARVDVSLSIPCYVEEISDASRLVEKFVTVKLLNEFKVLEGREDEREEEPELFIADDSMDIPF